MPLLNLLRQLQLVCLSSLVSLLWIPLLSTFSLIYSTDTATAVVSAASATEYLHGEIGGFDVFWPTLAILAVFALLVFFGTFINIRIS